MTCLVPASANEVSIYYFVQSECGADLPEIQTLKQLPFTSGVPSIQRETLQSAELDGSPEITGIRLGSLSVASDQGVELSFGTHDDLLESAMQSSWQISGQIAAQPVVIDATAMTATITGYDATAEISEGDLIKFIDMVNTGNAQPLLVTSINFSTDTVIGLDAAKVQNDQLGIVGISDESATTAININDTLTVGTTRKFVTLIVEYGDIQGGPTYDLITDNEITGFNFNLAVNALVTGSFSAIGRSQKSNFTLPAGWTLEAAPSHKPYTGIDGCLIKDGLPLLLSTSADMTLDRGASATFVLCNKGVSHVSYGKATNTVSVGTFFYDYTLQSAYEGEIEGDYTVAASLDGQAMAFNYPTAIITGLDKDVSEGDISQTAELQAYKPTGGVSSLIIRRVS